MILTGIGVALAAGPLGCFVLWRRVVFFSDAVAHASLLGVGVGALLGVGAPLGVFLFTIAAAFLLHTVAVARARVRLPVSVFVFLLAYGGLALGVVMMSLAETPPGGWSALLFGDEGKILDGHGHGHGVESFPVLAVYAGAVLVLAFLMLLWRPLLRMAIDDDMARAEGVNTAGMSLVFFLLLAVVVALAVQVVGVLLVGALLVIPAAAARQLATSPAAMVVLAAVLGSVAAAGGFTAAFILEVPAGAAVAVAAVFVFVVSLLMREVGCFLPRGVANDRGVQGGTSPPLRLE